MKHGGCAGFLRLEAGRSPQRGDGRGEKYNKLPFSAGPDGGRKKPGRRWQLFNSLFRFPDTRALIVLAERTWRLPTLHDFYWMAV
ncbi:MAG: hypothetical protein PQJ61_00485 [Spirochaetales bacterium]|uniref:Uncharacterized protein n=1 Tax=Candidatus Thalassospirochaeta sargassi TaxID=3119039 RepID=A0AAJ1I9L3_9SPIO|nr:hypothetical protein [Spirochaetales bacterium]